MKRTLIILSVLLFIVATAASCVPEPIEEGDALVVFKTTRVSRLDDTNYSPCTVHGGSKVVATGDTFAHKDYGSWIGIRRDDSCHGWVPLGNVEPDK